MPSRPSFFTQALLAVVFIAAVLGALILQESPTGRVEGVVRSEVTGAPLPRARIVLTNLDEEAPVQVKRARADKEGHFSLRDVPVGAWELTATTAAHGGEAVNIQVEEGETTPIEVALERTQPELDVAPIQRTFTPTAKIFVPLRGYTDKEGNPLKLNLYRTRFADLAGSSQLMDELRKTGNRYEPVTAIPRALAAKSSLVKSWEEPLTGADGEGFFHQRVSLPVTEPGIYLIQAGHGKKSACSWINVTNLALVVKRSRRQPGQRRPEMGVPAQGGFSRILTGDANMLDYVCYVTDMTTGKPVAGTTVTEFRGNKRVPDMLITNGQGLMSTSLPADNNSSVSFVASGPQGEAFSNSSSYYYDDEGGGGQTVATYTERPIYRPGDTIYYKGIVRRPKGEAFVYTIPRAVPVTVELRDTSGERLSQTQTKTNDYGSYWGAVKLSSEASTGYYSLVTSINGSETTTDVQVAAYRKPEMTVEVKALQDRATSGDTVQMAVDAKYYFGSAVAGAKVRYEVYRETDWRAEYPPEFGYTEEDAETDDSEDYGGYYGEYMSEGEATLDLQGHAIISFKAAPEPDPEATEPETPPQSEIWTARVTVTDAADREVEASGGIKVTAGDFRLGLEPDGALGAPNQPKTLDLSARNYDGDTPVSGQPIKLEWGTENWDEDTGKLNYKPLGSQTVTTGADGKASTQLAVAQSGSLRVTASTTDKAGRPIETQQYIWLVSEGEEADFGPSEAALSIVTDRRRYERGQTARVLINAAKPAQSALVTIEGEQLYKAWTVTLKGPSTEVRVPLPASYGPNVSLGVCYVKDGQFQQSDASLRVEVPEREVQVTVVPDNPKHEPGERVGYTITTRNAAGKPVPAEFSLAVVDEAIYALKSDDPHLLRDTFYPRRSNNVDTSNSLAVEYLGDTSKDAPEIKARRRFVDTAYWLPDGRTDGSGTAKISFNLPDNLTEWRATVLAQTQDSAFGRGITPVTASKPFLVRLDKPRFAVEGDVLRLVGTVHNETGAPQQATVKLEAPDLTTSDDLTQTLSLQPGEEKTVEWRVTPGANDAVIKVSAWTQDQKFTDAVEETLKVRPYGREQVETTSGSLGGTKNVTLTVHQPERTRVVVRLSAGPMEAITDSFQYLLGYPYGCVEQTSSRMFPDLLAQRLIKLSGNSNLIDAKTAAELPDMTRDGIVRLTKMQHEDGDWGWWDYDGPNAFLTGYALQTLALAKAQGYDVSDSVIKRGAEAALKMTQQEPEPEKGESKQAYAGRRADWVQNRPWLLLAAASAGEVDQAAELRATLDLKTLDSPALANTALLDRLLPGQRRDAYEALLAKGSDDGTLLFWKPVAPSWESDYDAVSATALALRAALAYEPANSATADKALRFLMSRRTGDYWESTRDTATVMHALVDYVAARPESMLFSDSVPITVNGNAWRTVNLSDKAALKRLEVPHSMLREGENEIGFNGASGFYSVDSRYTAPPAAGTTLPPLSVKGVKVTREFLRALPMKPGSLRPPFEPLNGQAQRGEPVTIRLTIETPQDLAYVLVEDTFPAGCEPTQLGSADVSSGDDWDYWWNDTEVRDDRIAFFATTLSKGKHVIEYSLRAQTPGEYRVLPTLLMPMYAPEIRAESGEARLVIQ